MVLRRLTPRSPRSRFATTMSSVVLTNTEPETSVVETAPAPDIDEEEPQNPLTQKFTDKEWAALKEFRVRSTTLML